jgi:hypothetical protein
MAAMSTSVDGFVAGAEDSPEQGLGVGGEALFKWFGDGDTPSRHYPGFKMSAVSAKLFDDVVDQLGAGVTGRRTYDELNIHLVPVVLGHGVGLLDGLDTGSPQLELVGVLDAPGVTHLSYRVVK